MIDVYDDIREAFVLLETHAGRALERRGLRTEQFNALRVLAEGTFLRMGELSARLLSDDSRTTRTVDSLCAAGLAARSADSSDRRVILVSITEDGLRAERAAAEAVTRAVESAVSELPARDLSGVASALRRLRTALRLYDQESRA
jgi:DNA-binding MarR family transcriptional regulator